MAKNLEIRNLGKIDGANLDIGRDFELEQNIYVGREKEQERGRCPFQAHKDRLLQP